MTLEEIAVQVRLLRQAIDQARRTYEQREAFYRAEIEELQKACPHPADHLDYHPDPSGNHDSWHECKVCGATL